MVITKKIHVKGLVQGVGFRPFIYRLAYEFDIMGTVENRSDGLEIIAQNISNHQIDRFIQEITNQKPLPSVIFNIESCVIESPTFDSFSIVKSSESDPDEITEISPDICVCPDCLEDLSRQEHRIDYPLINCTNCGPRFSIIKNLPYDRFQTTMDEFPMCEHCKSEYTDVMDRRFHAQPVACNTCGPHYSLESLSAKYSEIYEILCKTQDLLDSGETIAIKGTGGYHLVCDALNQKAVENLRRNKHRESKPFAVMCSDITSADEIANINQQEKKELRSWRRPIVLLQSKNKLAESVCRGFNSVGVMLPSMPFHFQLFNHIRQKVLVFTSANLSDDPIIIDDKKAVSELAEITHYIISFNRAIHNRSDDSVVFYNNESQQIIRRSRGYVPQPYRLNLNVEGIFAAGAELSNSFALGRGNQAILSQYIGDLKNLSTLEFYEESVERFSRMFRFKPNIAVCDLHPDYLSSRYAETLNIETIKVQHHHAHIVSTMASNHITEKVIGMAMDGTGLGTDGNIWGGEFLLCDFKSYDRINHFEYVPIQGGDAATKESWRATLSYLHHYFGEDFTRQNLDFIKHIPDQKVNLCLQALDKKINSPLSSSAGRLFDAVAALTGICSQAGFHAEAPMRLEGIIAPNNSDLYDIEGSQLMNWKIVFEQIIQDLNSKVDKSIISARFHNTFIHILCLQSIEISKQSGIKTIALSGGSFQNKYILKNIIKSLKNHQLDVLIPQGIPANDGGIALGQMVIAAALRSE